MRKLIPRCPPNFAKTFIQGGWQLIELQYGGRTTLHNNWLRLSGGAALKAARRDHMKALAKQVRI